MYPASTHAATVALLVGGWWLVQCYDGMIIGESSKADDYEVNPTKQKDLNNFRAGRQLDNASPRRRVTRVASCARWACACARFTATVQPRRSSCYLVRAVECSRAFRTALVRECLRAAWCTYRTRSWQGGLCTVLMPARGSV